MRPSIPVFLVAALAAPTLAHAAWQTEMRGGMTTHLEVPESRSAVGDGRALLIVLHGCIQTASNLRDKGTFSVVAASTGTVIALPQVPGGGVIAGCWDYYGSNHDRSSRHDDDLLALVDDLLGDAALDIDPDQVYLAGLSSGAGEAAVMGCLAPDVFAGIGIAAGPAVGTNESQIAFVSTTAQAAAQACTSMAGTAADAFATQHVAVIAGTMDYTVAQGYAQVHGDMFASLYEADDPLTEVALDPSTLPGAAPSGSGSLWVGASERIAVISLNGLGHAWPTGTGTGFDAQFVSPNGIDFAQFLAEWFQAQNTRVDGAPTPGDSGDDGSDDGTAGDDEGAADDAADDDDGAANGSGGTPNDGGSESSEGAPEAGDADGCNCRSTPGRTTGLGWLVLLALLGRMRRARALVRTQHQRFSTVRDQALR